MQKRTQLRATALSLDAPPRCARDDVRALALSLVLVMAACASPAPPVLLPSRCPPDVAPSIVRIVTLEMGQSQNRILDQLGPPRSSETYGAGVRWGYALATEAEQSTSGGWVLNMLSCRPYVRVSADEVVHGDDLVHVEITFSGSRRVSQITVAQSR